jgi:rare lipoprotein A (peptidoglycan hydrolase)
MTDRPGTGCALAVLLGALVWAGGFAVVNAAPATAEPTGEVGTALIAGKATWYCSESSACTRGYGPSDMVAAIDPTLGIAKGEWVTVTHGSRAVVVRIVDVCACTGSRVIDLTSGAFSRLADPSRGVIDVEIETGTPSLPATDTAP